MKKSLLKSLFCILLCGIVCLTGCSNSGNPRGISDEAYRLGKKALETIDSYLDGDKTADEACDQLDRLEEMLQLEQDKEDAVTSQNEKEGKDTHDSESASIRIGLMTALISLTSHYISLGDSYIEEILTERNELAECLEMPSR